jgi:hypothetical protein
LRQPNCWRILNKNAEKYPKICAPKNMYKNLAHDKNLAHAKNLAHVKNLAHAHAHAGMSPPGPAFMGRLFPVLYRLLVPSRHAQIWLNLWRRPNLWRPPEISLISVKPQQSLSLLIGALLKSRKNTNNHCCCPISAVILTTSELEANLKNLV